MPRKRDRAHSDGASGPLHQYRLSSNVAPDMNGTMGRYTGYSKASAFLRRHVLRERLRPTRRRALQLSIPFRHASPITSLAPRKAPKHPSAMPTRGSVDLKRIAASCQTGEASFIRAVSKPPRPRPLLAFSPPSIAAHHAMQFEQQCWPHQL
jgi:hypothetical protein